MSTEDDWEKEDDRTTKLYEQNKNTAAQLTSFFLKAGLKFSVEENDWGEGIATFVKLKAIPTTDEPKLDTKPDPDEDGHQEQNVDVIFVFNDVGYVVCYAGDWEDL